VASWLEAPGYTNPLGTSGPFVVALDYNTSSEEKILCSGITGTTIAVATGGRGYDGTPAQSHSSNATAVVVWTALEAEELNNIAQQTLGAVTAAGDTLYGSAANTLSKLPIGTTGQFLTVTGGVPAWSTYAPPVNPYLMATLTSAQSITNTASTLKFDNHYGSILGTGAPSLATSTGIVTVNKTGLYEINANVALAIATSSTKMSVKMRIGGTDAWAFAGPISPDSTFVNGVNSTLVLPLTSGQTIEIILVTNSATGIALAYDASNAAPFSTSMSVAYIGPTS
jgi:hypothetical protein